MNFDETALGVNRTRLERKKDRHLPAYFDKFATSMGNMALNDESSFDVNDNSNTMCWGNNNMLDRRFKPQYLLPQSQTYRTDISNSFTASTNPTNKLANPTNCFSQNPVSGSVFRRPFQAYNSNGGGVGMMVDGKGTTNNNGGEGCRLNVSNLSNNTTYYSSSNMKFYTNSYAASRPSPQSAAIPRNLPQYMHSAERKYSRKVFVGGLPPDIDQDEIFFDFSKFGSCWVDWPHKFQTPHSKFPPKGYVFVVFDDEISVDFLLNSCRRSMGKYLYSVSSPTVRSKTVQIRPWRLSDADYVYDIGAHLDPRKTAFIGGVPRTMSAFQLASLFNTRFGGVCYVGIDTDNELKYPKGAAKISFCTQMSFVAAISTRFIQIVNSEETVRKRVEVKPYVLDEQACDKCRTPKGPFFCPNVACLKYFCHQCWLYVHEYTKGRECHKPLVKEPGLQPATLPYRLPDRVNLWNIRPKVAVCA